MVAINRSRQYFDDNTPPGRPGVSRAETPRLTRIGSHGPPGDDLGWLCGLIGLIGWGLIVVAGIVAAAYTTGVFFGLGLRYAWSL